MSLPYSFIDKLRIGTWTNLPGPWKKKLHQSVKKMNQILFEACILFRFWNTATNMEWKMSPWPQWNPVCIKFKPPEICFWLRKILLELVGDDDDYEEVFMYPLADSSLIQICEFKTGYQWIHFGVGIYLHPTCTILMQTEILWIRVGKTIKMDHWEKFLSRITW